MNCSKRIVPHAAALLAGLPILFGPAPSAGPAAAQDRVSLNFAWPTDLKGAATFHIRKKRETGPQRRDMAMSGSYDIVTAPARDGIVISTRNFDVKVAGAGKFPGPQAKMQAFMIKAASTPPDFVVSRSGQYVRLQGLEQFQKNLREAVQGMVSDLPEDARLRVARAVEPMMSKAQLESSVANNWNRDVGTWLGASFDLGDTYELKFKTRMPMFGNLDVPMTSRFRFVARVPCRDGGKKKDCVDLEARTTVDSAGLNKALEEMIARLGGNRGETPTVKEFNVDTTVRLVTEPSTLIPHRVRSTKVSTAVIELGGQSRASRQVEEIVIAYQY